jgi:DNA-binding protein HU-beta
MKLILTAAVAMWIAGLSAHAETKPLAPTAIYVTIAEKTGMEKAQVQAVLDELAQLAYREARAGFTVPGIGKLVVVDSAARKGRNPLTGEAIQIPARQAVKFRVSKTCKDAVLGTGK